MFLGFLFDIDILSSLIFPVLICLRLNQLQILSRLVTPRVAFGTQGVAQLHEAKIRCSRGTGGGSEPSVGSK